MHKRERKGKGNGVIVGKAEKSGTTEVRKLHTATLPFNRLFRTDNTVTQTMTIEAYYRVIIVLLAAADNGLAEGLQTSAIRKSE